MESFFEAANCRRIISIFSRLGKTAVSRLFRKRYLVSLRNALSFQWGREGVMGRDQTMAAKETTVGVAMMHFIFTQKYLDNKDNRPQRTCESLDKLAFFSFLKVK